MINQYFNDTIKKDDFYNDKIDKIKKKFIEPTSKKKIHLFYL